MVRLVPQLPALLALSLVLPCSAHSMRSTHSMHSTAETEGESFDHTVLLMQKYFLLVSTQICSEVFMHVDQLHTQTIVFVYHLKMA